MVVGQNGRIWIEGDASGTRLARSALSVIREAGHLPDIESRVRGILEA
jgi:exosome complex RNA-binding protein Rrp4